MAQAADDTAANNTVANNTAAKSAAAASALESANSATAGMTSVAPILPVRDLAAAQAHYAALGFAVHVYGHGTGYGYAHRGGVELHMSEISEGARPRRKRISVYLFVEDADALYAEWAEARVAGNLVEPVNTEWGKREGAHIDPDGNLLRFGSPL